MKFLNKENPLTSLLKISLVLATCISLWTQCSYTKSFQHSLLAGESLFQMEYKLGTSGLFFNRDYYDVCIVGAGLSGAVIAEQQATMLGKTSLVIEKRDHIGGNVYDFVDEETNIRVSMYGAHLFHTKYFRVWEYVQQFSEWTPYEHKVLGRIRDKHVPIPVNIDTVNILFDLNINSTQKMDEWLKNEQVVVDKEKEPQNSEEMALSRVGRKLYYLIFKPYTIKQWAKQATELGPQVTARIPVRNNWDDRYFSDVFQALPTHGYTKMFQNIFNNPLIEVHTNVDYFDIRDKLQCGHTYFTGPIDVYFAHLGFEKLEYRSLAFERKVVRDIGEDKYHLPASVVNYPSLDYNFTRIVEYKHFLNQKSPHSVLYYERSNDDGEPYYPVPNQRNLDLFTKYQSLASTEPGVTFVGRLANYKYFNMDQSILNALELFDSGAPRVAVFQLMDYFSGGREALIQLALAFHAWMPTRTFFIHSKPATKSTMKYWFDMGYHDIGGVQTMNVTELKKGDIYIVPEIIPCQTIRHLIEKGVKVFIWQLSSDNHFVTENLVAGCKYMSHTHFLADFMGVNISRSHVALPYLTRGKANFGPVSNEKREDVILLNKDHPKNTLHEQLEKYCEQRKKPCKVVKLKDFNSTQLVDLYQRAKVVATSCLNGAERSVLEAVTHGTLLLTNYCGNGADNRDFPIPREHFFQDDTNKEDIEQVVERMLSNFENEQAKLDNIRTLYMSYGPQSLIEDTKRFMRNQNWQ